MTRGTLFPPLYIRNFLANMSEVKLLSIACDGYQDPKNIFCIGALQKLFY